MAASVSRAPPPKITADAISPAAYLPASSTSRRAGASNQKCSVRLLISAAEEIHEDAQTAEEDREPQVEVLEDPGEDRPVLFEVEQTVDVPVARSLPSTK